MINDPNIHTGFFRGKGLQSCRFLCSCQIVCSCFWKPGKAGYPAALEHSYGLISFMTDTHFLQKIFSFTGRNVLPGCIFIPLRQRSLSPCPWKVKLHTAWTVSLFLRTGRFLMCPTNDPIT